MATAEAALESDLEIIDLTGETTDSEGGERQEELYDPSSDGPDEASRAQLQAAIYALPEARLRHVVAGLVDTVPAVYRVLARELVGVSPVARVVVPRWETCANCGETYDLHADANEECTFHPGRLQVDEAKFLDWDEDCHGPMDSPHNRDEFPENFSWSCCSSDGLAGGCVTGRHSVAVPKKRRL
ncbi:hypothetical protein B0H17DRAFT_936479 [Mycena rosella]|uniref:C2H2-type domain-containing protein n=1 Tax=Mycena rosella TaxID=1033263 RepID=A0AAD7DFV9_MYCRO|nr:hypothetical protein B0H17DRAFT_936479 [Mycena rosella]